jgi:NADH-quinone oxidoreductase subunit G
MVEIQLDGQKIEVLEGSTVMHAAEKAGTYIPHFCYHKKLSIAANCRMCLVDVEKAPKPMPACATPVTQGMVVHTKSVKALKAQQSVMEFLLINHPLDCPICDQGGECQLQDLAVGYGGSAAPATKKKSAWCFHKDVGPLISMEEMSRCIHCTRCVRFGQEVAGVMELGMSHRGEHAEIETFVGMSVDSELSGNMIDICPVGALTSKPFPLQRTHLGAVTPQVHQPARLNRFANFDRAGQAATPSCACCRWKTRRSMNAGWPTATVFSYEALNSQRPPDRAR